MIFYKSHDTANKILEIVLKKEKGFYCRLGDGCIMLSANGRAGWQPATGNIRTEAREFLALEHPNIIKSFPADCMKHGVETFVDGTPVGVEAKECFSEQRDKYVASLVKKARKHWVNLRNPDCPVYSLNTFWYLPCYDQPFAIDFFKRFRSQFDYTIHVGNENDKMEILQLFFGKNVIHIPSPRKDAYSEIDRMEAELVSKLDELNKTPDQYICVNMGCGCSGRCLGKRIWPKYDNIFIMDIGSIMDRVHNRITRTWMKVEPVTNEDMQRFLAGLGSTE